MPGVGAPVGAFEGDPVTPVGAAVGGCEGKTYNYWCKNALVCNIGGKDTAFVKFFIIYIQYTVNVSV